MNRKQRRAKEKEARQRNKGASPLLGLDYGIPENQVDPEMWYACDSPSFEPEPEKRDVPGVNLPPVLAYHNHMVETNTWYDRKDLKEIIETIIKLSKPIEYRGNLFEKVGENQEPEEEYWSWAKNWDCKYINLRFDMRDGGFVMTNQKGERICLEQLKWQWKDVK